MWCVFKIANVLQNDWPPLGDEGTIFSNGHRGHLHFQWSNNVKHTHDGSMVLVYMLTWLGYIDGIHVTIYSIHIAYMDPMGYMVSRDGFRSIGPAYPTKSWPCLQAGRVPLAYLGANGCAASQPWVGSHCGSYKPLINQGLGYPRFNKV